MHWEDPPASASRTRWTAEFIDELKQHPGKWARLVAPDGRDTHGTSTVKAFTQAGCECRMTTKEAPANRVHAWVRWPEV